MKIEDDVYSPSAEEFRMALIAFMLTAGSIAYHRGREFGPKRFSYIATNLANEFSERFTINDAEIVIADFADSKRSLGTLFEELIYVAFKYRKSAEDAGITVVIPGDTTVFPREMGNVMSKEAVGDVEIVKDSLKFLLEKLPKWAQRIIEALMEALKITRGLV
jgi:hypothetical protein